MALKITENTTFVGKIDWGLTHFHGDQLSTHNGSSYNSYLIKDKKNVLIDGVASPFADEFVAEIEATIGIKNLDYIIALHGEPDHSSALKNIIELVPDIPVYCTANAVKSLKGYYHKDWNFKVVKTGDKLELGNGTITFLEASMLHWPDQMMCFYDKDNILFSSDAFGQHYASDLLFNDKVDMSVIDYEAIKYYANIVSPYSKMVLKKLEEVTKLNILIKMIAPSHGVIWREPQYIINKYAAWANEYKENQITIVYDTMYGSTRKMAEAIAEGVRTQDKDVIIKIFNSSTQGISDILTETFRSKALLVGSPTYNNGVLNSMAGFLDELRGFRLTGKKAAAFGSFGWNSQSTKILTKMLVEDGFELFETSEITWNWNPTNEAIYQLKEFGKKFAEFCK